MDEIIELLRSLDEKMSNGFATLRRESKADINSLRDEFKANMGSLRDELKADMGSLRIEFKADIGSLRDELKADMGSLRDELKADMGSLRVEFKADIKQLRAETNKGFKTMNKRLDVFQERLNNTEHEISDTKSRVSQIEREFFGMQNMMVEAKEYCDRVTVQGSDFVEKTVGDLGIKFSAMDKKLDSYVPGWKKDDQVSDCKAAYLVPQNATDRTNDSDDEPLFLSPAFWKLSRLQNDDEIAVGDFALTLDSVKIMLAKRPRPQKLDQLRWLVWRNELIDIMKSGGSKKDTLLTPYKIESNKYGLSDALYFAAFARKKDLLTC